MKPTNLVEDAQLNNKILEETIRVRTKQLATLNKQIKAAVIEAKKQTADNRQVINKFKKDLRNIKKLIKQTNEEHLEADKRYKEAIERNKKVVNDTTDRRLYLQRQEQLIAKVIEEGNAKVKDLEYVYAETNRCIKDGQQELLTVQNELGEKTQDIFVLEANISELRIKYKLMDTKYQITLQEHEKHLAQVVTSTDKQIAKLDMKLILLKEQEEAIDAKRRALQKERDDFALEKRRFEATKSLYSDI